MLKLSNVAELKQFCKEEWAKIPPQWRERLIASYRKCLIAVVATKGGTTSYSFFLQLLFHVVPGRLGQLFSFNKLNHYFKIAFCIYSGYLWFRSSKKCNITHSSVTNMQKLKKTKGQKPFHGTVLQTYSTVRKFCWVMFFFFCFQGFSAQQGCINLIKNTFFFEAVILWNITI